MERHWLKDIMKNKILAITLARGGSKGVRNKNIRILNGIPLIAHTIKEALKSKLIDKYIVSTDSKKIKLISQKFNAEAPFLRPKKLSNDKATSVSALQHAVHWMEKKENIKYDYIIELMCTNPFKTVSDIDNIIKKIIKTNADSVIAVHRIEDHHPSRIKKIINDQIYDFCIEEKKESRRQDLRPFSYIRSGSIYALKRDYLMNKNSRYGSNNSRPYILKQNKIINIDNELDFVTAEAMFNILKNKN